MDDLKPIIYIIFVVIFLVSRIIKGAKKFQEGQTPSNPPPVIFQPTAPVIGEAKKPVEAEKPKPKPATEIKQKVVFSERKKLAEKAAEAQKIKMEKAEKTKRTIYWDSIERTEPIQTPLEHIEKESGFSSLAGKMKQLFGEEKQEQPAALEFDPRQAFMMQTILERKFDA